MRINYIRRLTSRAPAPNRVGCVRSCFITDASASNRSYTCSSRDRQGRAGVTQWRYVSFLQEF